MKYNIEKQTEAGVEIIFKNVSKDTAKKVARNIASKTSANIYVTFFRQSDQQHGYLNPSVGHAITGEAW